MYTVNFSTRQDMSGGSSNPTRLLCLPGEDMKSALHDEQLRVEYPHLQVEARGRAVWSAISVPLHARNDT